MIHAHTNRLITVACIVAAAVFITCALLALYLANSVSDSDITQSLALTGISSLAALFMAGINHLLSRQNIALRLELAKQRLDSALRSATHRTQG